MREFAACLAGRSTQLLGGSSVEFEGLLQTHAEVGIALAGFASVVAALRRPLSALARQRFFSLLALSVIQILGCLLPIWFMQQRVNSEFGWRALSAVLVALNFMRIWWLIRVPARDFVDRGIDVQAIINPVVLFWMLNIVGLPLRPGFDMYYAGLLSTLLVGFVLFADVAVVES
jgi:hypothetical protein